MTNIKQTSKGLRASARLEVSPTPSNVIRNRGAAGQTQCADYSMTHTGPYDAISDTRGRRSGSSVRLKLPLPALHLLRCFRRCLLPSSSHCCPPSHGSWRVSHQHASRIDTCCIRFTTAQRKKQRYRLTKRVREREVTRWDAIVRSKQNSITALATGEVSWCLRRRN